MRTTFRRKHVVRARVWSLLVLGKYTVYYSITSLSGQFETSVGFGAKRDIVNNGSGVSVYIPMFVKSGVVTTAEGFECSTRVTEWGPHFSRPTLDYR